VDIPADLDGNFEFLKMKPGDYSLKFTFIVLEEKQLQWDNR